MQESICRGKKTLFDKHPKDAKKLCKGCPVANECRDYALIYKERGIWGGTSDYERFIIRSKTPQIRENLIREAIRLGLYEVRYSIAQYVDSIHAARQFHTQTVPVQPVDPAQLLAESQELLAELYTLLESEPDPTAQLDCA